MTAAVRVLKTYRITAPVTGVVFDLMPGDYPKKTIEDLILSPDNGYTPFDYNKKGERHVGAIFKQTGQSNSQMGIAFAEEWLAMIESGFIEVVD